MKTVAICSVLEINPSPNTGEGLNVDEYLPQDGKKNRLEVNGKK